MKSWLLWGMEHALRQNFTVFLCCECGFLSIHATFLDSSNWFQILAGVRIVYNLIHCNSYIHCGMLWDIELIFLVICIWFSARSANRKHGATGTNITKASGHLQNGCWNWAGMFRRLFVLYGEALLLDAVDTVDNLAHQGKYSALNIKWTSIELSIWRRLSNSILLQYSVILFED